jgi:hypothetical protein
VPPPQVLRTQIGAFACTGVSAPTVGATVVSLTWTAPGEPSLVWPPVVPLPAGVPLVLDVSCVEVPVPHVLRMQTGAFACTGADAPAFGDTSVPATWTVPGEPSAVCVPPPPPPVLPDVPVVPCEAGVAPQVLATQTGAFSCAGASAVRPGMKSVLAAWMAAGDDVLVWLPPPPELVEPPEPAVSCVAEPPGHVLRTQIGAFACSGAWAPSARPAVVPAACTPAGDAVAVCVDPPPPLVAVEPAF